MSVRGNGSSPVENPTRKYAFRAAGDVFVITGPVFGPNIAQSLSISVAIQCNH